MKRTIIFLSAILIQSIVYSQSYMVGIYRIQNNGCGDYMMEQQTIETGAEYETASLNFKANHKSENPTTYFVKVSEYAIVFEYTTHLYPGACKYKEIILKKGSSLEKIRAEQQDIYTRYKGNYVTAPKEIAVFSGKEVTSIQDEITTKEYSNLIVKIIPSSNSGQKTFATQLTNKNQNKSLMVKIKTVKKGSETQAEEKKVILPPGATITQKMGEAESFELLISEPFENFENLEEIEIVEKVKNWTKELIDLKKTTKTGAIGVRG